MQSVTVIHGTVLVTTDVVNIISILNTKYLIRYYIVLETNHCISNCQSNDCYTQCISDHWPGAKSGHSKTTAVSSVVWVPTSTAPASSSATWMPSPSAPVSSTPNSATTSVWSQSSSWAPSSTAWYPSYSCKYLFCINEEMTFI